MKGNVQSRPAARRMEPYHPPTGGREGMLRLDFNENTVGCSPAVAAFLRERLSEEKLAVYPEYSAALSKLAKHFGVGAESLCLTNGTDEAVQLLVHAYVDESDEVIIPYPSYAMYRFYAELAGAKLRMVPYHQETLDFPFDEMIEAVNDRTKAIFLANPNNPTGTKLATEKIEEILRRAPRAAVLVDEAYYEFSGETVLDLLSVYQNLFVCRTFSKAYGMAGLRLGCLLSSPENIALSRKVQSPYSVNTLAVLAAEAAVGDREYVDRYVAEVLSARDCLCAGLTDLGIRFHQSAANFVLLRLGDRARSIRDGLRADGILVRDRSYEIQGCVRVTVGTREQMKRLLEALAKLRR